jgi:hypothetical protein
MNRLLFVEPPWDIAELVKNYPANNHPWGIRGGNHTYFCDHSLDKDGVTGIPPPEIPINR